MSDLDAMYSFISTFWRQCAVNGIIPTDNNTGYIYNPTMEFDSCSEDRLPYLFTPELSAIQSKLALTSNNNISMNLNDLLSLFTSIQFTALKISSISNSKLLLKFNSLTSLNLTGNRLISINLNYLPPALKLLNLSSNKINTIIPINNSSNHHHSISPLIHINLSYNLLTDSEINHLLIYSKTIKSINLNFNSLSLLYNTIEFINQFPLLQQLQLIGNPISINKYYKSMIITSIQSNNKNKLKLLDNIEIKKFNNNTAMIESKTDNINLNLINNKLINPTINSNINHKKSLSSSNNNNNSNRIELDNSELISLYESREFDRRLQSKLTEEKLFYYNNQNNLSSKYFTTPITFSIVIHNILSLPEPGRELLNSTAAAASALTNNDSTNKQSKSKSNSTNKPQTPNNTDNRSINRKSKSNAIESIDPNKIETITESKSADGLVSTKTIIKQIQSVTFYIQFRLADNTIYKSNEVNWTNNTSIEFNSVHSFQWPSLPIEIRNLFYLLGIQFYLYQKINIQTDTEIITNTTTMANNTTNSTAESTTATSTVSKSKSSSISGSNKKSKLIPTNSTIQSINTTSTTDTKLILLGLAHLDCSLLLNPINSNDLLIITELRNQQLKFTKTPNQSLFNPEQQTIIYNQNQPTLGLELPTATATATATGVGSNKNSSSIPAPATVTATATATVDPVTVLSNFPPTLINPDTVANDTSLTVAIYLNTAPYIQPTIQQITAELNELNIINQSSSSASSSTGLVSKVSDRSTVSRNRPNRDRTIISPSTNTGITAAS